MKKIYSLGVDIGGTNIKYIIIDNSGKEIDHYQNKTEQNKGRKIILQNVHIGITYISNKNKNIKISGIGIGSPGLISKNGKVITGAANLKGWNGTHIKKIIEKKTKIITFVDNDVTLLALGEAYFGAGKQYDKVLCLALGTGLGGGIIIDKHIYRGKNGYSGEFGHMVVKPNGPKCSCGNKGCLETYASTVGLKRMVKEHISKNGKTKILKYAKKVKDIMPIHLFQAYEKNDKTAKIILNEMSYYLALGIGNLYNIFDPDVVIIAGGISLAGRSLIILIKKHIKKFALDYYKNKINIKLSKYKHKSGVLGTASLVFDKLNIPVY